MMINHNLDTAEIICGKNFPSMFLRIRILVQYLCLCGCTCITIIWRAGPVKKLQNLETAMMMISVAVTSRRMGRSGSLHNLSRDDWPRFPNDALRCFDAECFPANYDHAPLLFFTLLLFLNASLRNWGQNFNLAFSI